MEYHGVIFFAACLSELRGIVQFDYPEESSLWILYQREPTYIGNIGRWHYDSASQRSGFLGALVTIGDGKINHPVWRHAAHFRGYFVHSARIFRRVFEK